jgi:hypothetical protein
MCEGLDVGAADGEQAQGAGATAKNANRARCDPTWIAVDDMTYRLQDGPSRPDYHQQPNDSAQVSRIFPITGLVAQS